ncbi:Hypothetical Protein FCC1311_070892 [Hondaea fermentalgiana]|uniref:DASH complex subunit ASK1 n=1 Tax=Hondaea fermentalgiana TaxID=2315210 RepID=A0A2R5GKM9_9STRA|nr:Hypothetical Protein FCC1311_070892 [Hondaea fermentalgiana]|eukprot:GBG30869.1 Hypothetical Protein FCC1311_070892 [Hondaea fermentalgiana]
MQGEEVAAKLQEIDANFVKVRGAPKVSSCREDHVRAFDKAMQDVADGAAVWCHFFDHVRDVSSTPAGVDDEIVDDEADEESGKERARPRTAVKPARRAGRAWNPQREMNAHDESAASDLSSQNPPTPTLPVFSKSFAKTPMFRKMRSASASPLQDEDVHDGSEDGNANESLIMDFKTPQAARTPSDHNATAFAEEGANILDLSEISAATPGTPQDGDYGPSSAVKSRQLLEYGTPARHVTNMILGSNLSPALGANAEANTSDASSNPATPVPLSPFMTDALLHTDSKNDQGRCDERDKEEEGEAEEELLGTPRRSHSIDYEDLHEDTENVQMQPTASAQGLAQSPSTKTAPSAKLTDRRLAAVTGTPISRSVARRRRRSLMQYAAETGETGVFGGGNSSENTGFGHDGSPEHDSEEELLNMNAEEDMVNDGPPPAFDLKLFPHLFQSGEGAAQVTAVYSQFASHEAFCLAELRQRLPKYGQARLELMLDMLVSRGLLRPFTLENHLYWRAPSEDEF